MTEIELLREDKPLTATTEPKSRTVIRNASLIDGVSNHLRTGMDIEFDSTGIAKISSTDPTAQPDSASNIIDASGKYVMPGIVNGNIHLLDGIMMMGVGGIEYLARWEGRLSDAIIEASQVALRSGVTTVFDTWNATDPVLTARDRIAAGDAQGAQIFCAGNIVGMGGPFSADFHMNARTTITKTFANRIDNLFEAEVGHQLSLLPPREVRAIIRSYIDRGIDMLKVAVSDHLVVLVGTDRGYLTFSDEVLKVIVDETKNAGIPLLTHTMSLSALRMSLPYNPEIMIHASITGQQPIDGETLDSILATGTTCGVQTVTQKFQDKMEEQESLWAWYGGNEHARNEKKFLAEGVPVMLGTDAGCTTHDVLCDSGEVGDPDRPWTLGTDHITWARGIQEKGMNPMDILKACTKVVADGYGKGDSIGSIEVGKRADILVLDRNPLDDLQNLDSICGIFQRGVAVDRDALPTDPMVTAPTPNDHR